MKRRAVFVISAMLFLIVAALAVLIYESARERSYSYRFKLTLVVDTPDGPKTGSSVVEETIRYTLSPAVGWREDEGEAVFVDLGPGRPPLIALLTDTMKSLRDPRSRACQS